VALPSAALALKQEAIFHRRDQFLGPPLVIRIIGSLRPLTATIVL
jgi:hypothetical protein